MGSGRFSDYQVGVWLRGIGDIWLALHYDNPEIAGAYASEVFGGSYERQRISFGPPLQAPEAPGDFGPIRGNDPVPRNTLDAGRFRITQDTTAISAVLNTVGRGIFNTTAARFSGLPAVEITHLCGWDAKVNGNMLFVADLDVPHRAVAGGTFPIPESAIALSID